MTQERDLASLAEMVRGRGVLDATPISGAVVTYTRDAPPADWLVDGDEEGSIAAHREAHAAGRASEAAVAYGADVDAEVVAQRLIDLAALAEETGSLDVVLERIVEMIEAADPKVRGSVLLVDEGAACLRSAAGKRLPSAYVEAVDGIPIDEGVGSCGTAAHRGERVVVEDVRESPLWAPYLELAVMADARACWSEPIRLACGAPPSA